MPTWYSAGRAEVNCARLHTDTAPRPSVQESREGEVCNRLQKGAIGLLLYIRDGNAKSISILAYHSTLQYTMPHLACCVCIHSPQLPVANRHPESLPHTKSSAML